MIYRQLLNDRSKTLFDKFYSGNNTMVLYQTINIVFHSCLKYLPKTYYKGRLKPKSQTIDKQANSDFESTRI